MINITAENGSFVIRYRFDHAILNGIKDIPGRKFINSGEKYWTVPRESGDALAAFADRFGADFSDAAAKLLETVSGRQAPAKKVSKAPDNLTDEQAACRFAAMDCLPDGFDNLKVSAYAGTGKTFTLKVIAESMPHRRGVYLAFNKSIADEAARKFPGSVECRTAHSFAYRALDAGRVYGDKLKERLTPRRVAELLSIPKLVYGRNQAGAVTGIRATLAGFCQSADSAIEAVHVPDRVLGGIEDPAKQQQFRMFCRDGARELWALVSNPARRDVAMTHDVYLKLWQLRGASLNADYVLFDEAQDANPVLLDIVNQQAGSQKIYVGDRHQQIYAWRGAVNAMADIDAMERRLTQSFRFGPAIADVANAILGGLKGETVPVRGFEKRASRLGNVSGKHTVICRTNVCLFGHALQAIRAGQRIAVAGGIKTAVDLMESGYWLFKGNTDAVSDPAIKVYQDWQELVGASEDDPDLKLMVGNVEDHGDAIPGICSELRQSAGEKEEGADLVLTTAHKSKGREWPQVKLASDFLPLKLLLKRADEGEFNLLYVAATRALEVLEGNGTVQDVMNPGLVETLKKEVAREFMEGRG